MAGDSFSTRRFNRFHGRVESDRPCAAPGCEEPGEFRAPPVEGGRSHEEGPRWRKEPRSGSGYTVRHPEGF